MIEFKGRMMRYSCVMLYATLHLCLFVHSDGCANDAQTSIISPCLKVSPTPDPQVVAVDAFVQVSGQALLVDPYLLLPNQQFWRIEAVDSENAPLYELRVTDTGADDRVVQRVGAMTMQSGSVCGRRFWLHLSKSRFPPEQPVKIRFHLDRKFVLAENTANGQNRCQIEESNIAELGCVGLLSGTLMQAPPQISKAVTVDMSLLPHTPTRMKMTSYFSNCSSSEIYLVNPFFAEGVPFPGQGRTRAASGGDVQSWLHSDYDQKVSIADSRWAVRVPPGGIFGGIIRSDYALRDVGDYTLTFEVDDRFVREHAEAATERAWTSGVRRGLSSARCDMRVTPEDLRTGTRQ